jgi:hypothetical protein
MEGRGDFDVCSSSNEHFVYVVNRQGQPENRTCEISRLERIKEVDGKSNNYSGTVKDVFYIYFVDGQVATLVRDDSVIYMRRDTNPPCRERLEESREHVKITLRSLMKGDYSSLVFFNAAHQGLPDERRSD